MSSTSPCHNNDLRTRFPYYHGNAQMSLLNMMEISSLNTPMDASFPSDPPNRLSPEKRRQQLIRILDMALELTDSSDFDN